MFWEELLICGIAPPFLPPERRVPYFIMSSRQTRDVDISWRDTLPYAPQRWSSLIGLEANSCATLLPYYILLLSRCCHSRCVYLPREASIIPSQVCGLSC